MVLHETPMAVATLEAALIYRADLIAELRAKGIWEHDALDALKVEVDRVNSEIAVLLEARCKTEAVGAAAEEG